MPFNLPNRLQILATVLAVAAVATLATAEVTILGVQYKADQAFPEHDCFWDAAQYPASCPLTSPLGGSIHVFLRNAGTSSVTVQDVNFVGFSLAEILVLHYQVAKRQPASIWLDPLSGEQLQTLLDAGEPVWYKIDPATIAPGGTSQVIVRLRMTPTVPTIAIDVVHGADTVSTVVPVQLDQPRLVGASFSSDLAKAYLYWRRAPGAGAPTTILFDGANVTANTTTVSDPALPYAASVVQLSQPLSSGSMHVFQGVYADGKAAGAGVRAWNNQFIYGQWSAMPTVPENDPTATRATVDDATNRGINAMVVQGETSINHLVGTVSGRQYLADHGYGFVMDPDSDWPITDPLMWFIRDEPDAADSRVTGIPGDKMVGSLAQMAVQTGETLRARNPAVPTTLNLDGTYKPFNWYNYGQVPDVMMVDAYYEPRLRDALWYNHARIPLFSKATYRYAVAQLAQSAAEPNPLHCILYSCQYIDTTYGDTFPFAAPQAKRIELYYALAGGAKGFSYWWFKPANSASDGLGDGGPAAMALWKEIGLLGNEIRTVAPLLVTSCPATLTLQPSTGVWARSLLVGSDTMMLLAVNDQYYNDQQGCHYTPVANASVAVTLPAWIQSPTAFEIAAGGISDVATQVAGNQLQVSLGTLNVTRMIVITSNTSLRSTIEQRYTEQVRPKVCAFAPEVCLGPTITQQPAARSVCLGAAATFTVAATGSGTLSYQWQKNSNILTNGGHYSGCTTATLTASSCDSNDAANYRCAVTDSNGSTNSNQAALTLKAATTITQHPSNQSVPQGQTAIMTVAATGDGTLSYQWQKNSSNVTNGGHYSGCTTATLTVSSCDSNDAAGYRCVVTGGCGSATSNAALLTLGQPGDFDHDGDVDLDDFAHFQACLTGPLVAQTDPQCQNAKLDANDYVDAADLAVFLRCMSGAHVPANPNCAN